MTSRPAINVEHLPNLGFDYKSPLWWGNLWLMTIETVMFGIVAASYFYVRMNFEHWPPPRVNDVAVLYDTDPNLLFGTLNTLLLLLSCVPVFFWIDRAARRKQREQVKLGLSIAMLVGVAAIALRFLEFRGIHFSWNENAYASVVWMMLGAHLLHLVVATLECFVMATHAFRHPLDEKHALDMTITAIYWYWVVGIWIFTYAIVYFGARVL